MTIRPKPPKDLWEQMDALRDQLRSIPYNAFTAHDYAERYGVTRHVAYGEIQKMIAAGKVRKVENSRSHYVMV